MVTESKSTSDATDTEYKSAEDQITDLLMDTGETGGIDEEPEPKEEEATQEEETGEADQPEPGDSKQEAAKEEAATWGQALGLDDSQIVLDDSGNFTGVITNVEGKTQQVDLKELVKGYQIDSYNTNRSKAMAEERKQFEEYASKQADAYQAQVKQAEGLVNTLEQQLVGEYDGINWEQLRMSDPAEYAARRQDLAVRYQQVQNMANGIQQEQQQMAAQAQQKTQQANAAHLQSEAQKALEMKPEWQDPTVRQQAMTDMGDFIQKKYGYSPNEVAGITDHRVIGLIEDAMAYQAIKTKSVPKIKKAVPKFQKPGTGKKSDSKNTQLNKLYKKAAASSSRDLKDDAITQLLLNS